MNAPSSARSADVAGALARSAVFGVLDAVSLAQLATDGQVVELRPGEGLVARGDPGDAAFLILQGAIEVRALSAGGDETILATLGPGEIVGEMAVLDGGPRSADMAALRSTRMLRITRAAFLNALAAHPQAALALIASLSLRLRQVDARLEARHVLDLGGRLSRALLEAANGDGLVAVTQTELARRVGASREKVNRKLHAWAAEGVLRLDRTGARILSPARLSALAGIG